LWQIAFIMFKIYNRQMAVAGEYLLVQCGSKKKTIFFSGWNKGVQTNMYDQDNIEQ
jgi:hypothetical protein